MGVGGAGQLIDIAVGNVGLGFGDDAGVEDVGLLRSLALYLSYGRNSGCDNASESADSRRSCLVRERG